jgi:hypothetical protein
MACLRWHAFSLPLCPQCPLRVRSTEESLFPSLYGDIENCLTRARDIADTASRYRRCAPLDQATEIRGCGANNLRFYIAVVWRNEIDDTSIVPDRSGHWQISREKPCSFTIQVQPPNACACTGSAGGRESLAWVLPGPTFRKRDLGWRRRRGRTDPVGPMLGAPQSSRLTSAHRLTSSLLCGRAILPCKKIRANNVLCSYL